MNDRPAEYVYLASPYSRASEELREERYLAARDCTTWMLRNRRWVYSPIVHCHDLARAGDLPNGFDYWQEYNKAMLIFARALYVLTIPGWRESDGVAWEIAFAKSEGILVRYVAKQGEGYEVRSAPWCP